MNKLVPVAAFSLVAGLTALVACEQVPSEPETAAVVDEVGGTPRFAKGGREKAPSVQALALMDLADTSNPTILRSFNVTTFVRTGVGRYYIIFDPSIDAETAVVSITAHGLNRQVFYEYVTQVGGGGSPYGRIMVWEANNTNFIDPAALSIVLF